MKIVMQTNDPAALAFAQALLDGEGIAFFVLDVHMSSLEGSIGILPRRLAVPDRDAARAREILTENGLETVEGAG